MKTVKKTLIVLVLIGQLCCQGLYFPVFDQFPAYLLLLVLLGMVTLLDYFLKSQGVIRIKRGQNFSVIAVLLVMNITMVCLLNGRMDFQRIALIGFSFLMCLACYQVIEEPADIGWLTKAYIAVVAVSTIVEVGQVFEVPFAEEIWRMTHVGDRLENAIKDGRFLGLASDSLQFGYHVTAAIAFTLYTDFKGRGFWKKLLLGLFVFGLLTNNTRSAQLAVLIVLFLWLVTRHRNDKQGWVKLAKTATVIAICVVAVFMVFNFDTFLESTRFGQSDSGTVARVPMLLTAFNHAIHHPFGMGIYSVQPELVVGTTYETYSYVVGNTAHSVIGNCVASYGFLGLLLLIMLYWNVVSAYRKTRRSMYSDLFVGVFCATIGLLFNAMFHNSYILNGELSSFLCFGILLASTKLSVRKEEK